LRNKNQKNRSNLSNNLYDEKENNNREINSKDCYNFEKKIKLFKRNFLFEFTMLRTYVYFMNANFQFINFRKNKEFSLELDNRRRVKRIIKYKNKECYIVKKKNHFLATISFFEDHLILLKLNFAKIRLSQKIILKKMKAQLKNSIIIYNLSNEIAKYVKIINRHLRI